MGIKEVKRQANIRKWTAVFSDRNASGLTVRQYEALSKNVIVKIRVK